MAKGIVYQSGAKGIVYQSRAYWCQVCKALLTWGYGDIESPRSCRYCDIQDKKLGDLEEEI